MPGFTVTLAFPVAEYVPLVAEASTAYVATAASPGMFIVMETDTDEPSESSRVLRNDVDHPLGSDDARSKALPKQVVVSLLVNVTEYVTLCLRFALGLAGDIVTVGLAAMHALVPYRHVHGQRATGGVGGLDGNTGMRNCQNPASTGSNRSSAIMGVVLTSWDRGVMLNRCVWSAG